MLSMETRGPCFTDRDAMMSDTENCTVTSFRERTFGFVHTFAMGQQKKTLENKPKLEGGCRPQDARNSKCFGTQLAHLKICAIY